MRQTLSRGVFAAAAATSVLSLYGSSAFADTQADGVAQNSAGVLSGNTVQAPVEVPVNACGNTVDAAAALNPAFGNSCDAPTGATSTPATTPSPATPGSPIGTVPPSAGDSSTPPVEQSAPPTGDKTVPPSRPHTPPAQHSAPPQLAETGSANTGAMLAASAASATLIAGGAVLYRRGRAAGFRR